MVLNYIRENKGKSLLIAGIILIWLLLLALFRGYGYKDTWQLWNVNSRELPFWDFRLIPGSAESFRNGFEPSIENPFDPGQRIFNYPAFWRLFFYTNISQEDTVWAASLMIILFFASVIIFPQELSVSAALGMLVVLFSPAAMLLYERGNADLIVFFICVLAILAMDISTTLSAGILLFGAVVKMFPFFALTIFLREPKRKFIQIVLASLLFMLVYSVLTFESQRSAWFSTARSGDRSYGAFVFISRFSDYVQTSFPNLFTFDQWRFLFELAALLLISLGVVLAALDRKSLPASNERNLAAFRMGASIYAGTFMLGNSWDYRLAFLVLVVPQLTQWFRASARQHRYAAVGTMIGVVLSCWYILVKIDLPFIPLKDPLNRGFVFDEMINWLLLLSFTYLLLVSSPTWLRQGLHNAAGVFNKNRVLME